jgi:DNA-binding response OmpR family regulator
MIMRVLIVDDDRDHAESIADVLAWRGCEVELAFSGEEAVDKFRNASFEFVLMDIKLPGIDGIEVFFECKKIRAQPNILLMTGYSLDHLARRALEGGALGVLQKPFAMQEIFDVVQRIAGQTPSALAHPKAIRVH